MCSLVERRKRFYATASIQTRRSVPGHYVESKSKFVSFDSGKRNTARDIDMGPRVSCARLIKRPEQSTLISLVVTLGC